MRLHSTAAVIFLTGPLLFPAQAFAEVTAADVWEDWLALSESYGQTIEVGEERYRGGVLSLSGVTTQANLPDGEMSGTLGEIVLTEGADGSVTVTLPAEYPLTMRSQDEGTGDEVEMAMVVRQSGLDLVATGESGAIEYSFSAPSVSVSIDDFVAGGETVEMSLVATLSDTTGSYGAAASADGALESLLEAASLGIVLSLEDPAEGVSVDMTVSMTDIANRSTGTISPFAAGAELSQMLRQGFASEGRMTTGGTTFEIAVDNGETPVEITGRSDGGDLDFSVGEDGILYSGENRGLAATLAVTSMPLPPFTFEIAEAGGEVRMPLIETEENQEFGLKLNLAGLALGDTIWSMFDPMGGLPRDPADLSLDLSGQGRWSVDITDPDAMADLESSGAMPGEVDAISLNRLALSFLGAELTGAGDFAFSDGPVAPVPAGLVNLRLTGGNAAIDSLVAAGLLPEEQAMGVRMMLNLFAQPGSGADELTTTLEFKDDGSVLANGQRIR